MNLDLTKQEIEYILNVLAQRPYIEVKELLDKMMRQLQPKEE